MQHFAEAAAGTPDGRGKQKVVRNIRNIKKTQKKKKKSAEEKPRTLLLVKLKERAKKENSRRLKMLEL